MAEVAGPSCDWCKVFDIAVFDSAESTILTFLCLFLNMHLGNQQLGPVSLPLYFYFWYLLSSTRRQLLVH